MFAQMNDAAIEQAYRAATEQYAKFGVDVAAALAQTTWLGSRKKPDLRVEVYWPQAIIPAGRERWMNYGLT